jgi:uncharacterized protein DUF4180
MDLTIAEKSGVRFVEGPLGLPLMRNTEDATLVLEACFSHRVSAALLYAPNLTDKFFDLSSGEAGAILQKLRNYRIRLGVVCAPDSVEFSSRFGDMAAEGKPYRLFPSVRLRPGGSGMVEPGLTAYFAYCLYSSAMCAPAASPE